MITSIIAKRLEELGKKRDDIEKRVQASESIDEVRALGAQLEDIKRQIAERCRDLRFDTLELRCPRLIVRGDDHLCRSHASPPSARNKSASARVLKITMLFPSPYFSSKV